MKPKTMILMVVAVGCGLAASYMTSQLLAERGNQGSDEQQEKVKVLVARSDLITGLLIKDPKQHFKEKLYIKGEEPSKAMTDKDYDQLKERRLIRPLKTDQFVSAEDLLDKNSNNLSSRLPVGMRAVGIKVSIENIAGGFASLPMAHVDIVSTIRRGDGDSVSQVLLENVLVLAADSETQRKDDRGGAMPASTVTVAVSPENALYIRLAQEMGSLSLILRGYDDKKSIKTSRVTGTMIAKGPGERRRLTGLDNKGDLLEGGGSLIKSVPDVKEKKPPVVEVKKPAPPVGPLTSTHILTIYNGDNGRRYPFKLDAKGRPVDEKITMTAPDAPLAPPEPRAEVQKTEEPKKPEPPKTGTSPKRSRTPRVK